MNKVFVLIGPTASGKTDLSVKIAEQVNSEIISADSRQIYKNIPIASSVPSVEVRNKIKHHFIEEFELDEEFNAGEFGKTARVKINEIFSLKKLPIIVGGSGLYIRSLIDGFFEVEIKDIFLRKKLYEELDEKGKTFLYEKLKKADPESAMLMDESKYKRVIRALEVFYLTGRKISELQTNNIKIDFEATQIGLLLDRKYLYDRINLRVEQMLNYGLVDEVIRIAENKYHYSVNNSLNTVGIKEVFRYLENKISYDEMVSSIKQNTRRYAKRQMTWFRKDKRINWLEIHENPDWEEIAQKIIKDYYNIFKNYL